MTKNNNKNDSKNVRKKRKEFLASLSDEERETYLEKERHQVEERMAFLRGVYGMNIDDTYSRGIKRK